MPTENRSSNTEMVSVPAAHDLASKVRETLDRQACPNAWMVTAYEAVVANFPQPAPQPHPEPIAWMVGTAFWWTKEEAERDAAETGLPIVGLGPMSGTAPIEQRQGEPLPITNDMHRLMEACRIGEFKNEGGSETVESLAVASLDAKSSMGHDADSYMAGYSAALYEQAEPFIWLSLNSQHQGEPEAPGKQGTPLEAVRANDIQDLLDRAATAIGQYGDSLLGRGQREDSVDLLDLEREVRDLEQEFRGAFALPGA